MINGGLGLRLANNTMGGKIAYGVVAGIFGVAFVVLILWHDPKSGKSQAEVDSNIALDESVGQSSNHVGNQSSALRA